MTEQKINKKEYTVYLPVKVDVPYTVKLANPESLEEVKKALTNIVEDDPSDWNYDPDFYENLYHNAKESIRNLKQEDLTDIVQETVSKTI